jgi:hypothetical protein
MSYDLMVFEPEAVPKDQYRFLEWCVAEQTKSDEGDSYNDHTGPDIGTTFAVKAVTTEATPRLLPPVQLTRGARRLAFLPGGGSLVVLRGEMQHKNLWLIDLHPDAERH